MDHLAPLAISARGLGLQIGGKTIIADIDLDLLPGELVAIIGPSGAGKSTLLRALSGIRLANIGRVAFHEDDHWYPLDEANRAAYLHAVGLVTQEDHLVRELSCRAQLHQACQHALVPAQEHQSRIEDALREVSLVEHGDTLVGDLSGGQRRRLSIARALIKRPRALFLDEPTSGLDIEVAHEIMDLLAVLADEGRTIVCTSHLPSTLLVCDRVLILGPRSSDETTGTLRADWTKSVYHEHLAKDRDGSSLYKIVRRLPLGEQEHEALPATDAQAPDPARPALPLPQLRAVMGRSYAALIGDPAALTLVFIIQPIVLTLIILATQSLHGNALPYLDFFACVAALWMGMTLSIRELVAERRLYAIEYLGGLRPIPYLAAKLLWVSVLALVATVVLQVCFTGGVLALHGERQGFWDDLGGGKLVLRHLVLSACTVSGAFIGLTLSALARTERAAVGLMPLFILPQVLFSRFATGTEIRLGGEIPYRDLASGSPWRLEFASWLEHGNAAIGLLTTSRHASWLMDGIVTGTRLLPDCLGLILVLCLELVAIALVVTLLQHRWIRSLR